MWNRENRHDLKKESGNRGGKNENGRSSWQKKDDLSNRKGVRRESNVEQTTGGGKLVATDQ